MFKPLAVNLPYPSLDGITKDKRSAAVVGTAYANSHGELNAILQYVYHYLFFKKLGEEDTASTVISIAIAEMFHLETLGELLLRLGTDPVFTAFPPYAVNFYTTANISYSKTAEKMLLDDVTGELVAIDGYERILRSLKNERVQAVISRIKLDEELHVKALKDRLEDLRAKRQGM